LERAGDEGEKTVVNRAAQAVTFEGVIDPRDAAISAGLIYVSDARPGISRARRGAQFRYFHANGKAVTDDPTLDRIRRLAVPPAYTDVWICANPNGHIQATGRDAKGRKQYRYHTKFREVREGTKYEHMLEFAVLLPTIRARIDKDMRLSGLPREKVLATIVHLLEATMIRVGNENYAKENKSYGLTTLQNRHLRVEGAELKFTFKGKSGKQWSLQIRDRRVAKLVKAIQELPGQHLFQYLGQDGERRDVSSGDVNAYLKEISGRNITAKDFRTWTGTVLAALALSEFERFDSPTAAKKNIRAAIETVASRLGNTPTICRKCYIHPQVLESYLSEELVLEAEREVDRELAGNISALNPEETLVLAFLKRRLDNKAKRLRNGKSL
jgi:DNA topoisomerase-1